jgi:hypothetical protein
MLTGAFSHSENVVEDNRIDIGDHFDDDDFEEAHTGLGFFRTSYKALEQYQSPDSSAILKQPRNAVTTSANLSPESRRPGTPPLKSLASPEHVTMRRVSGIENSPATPATPGHVTTVGLSDSEDDELLPAMAAQTPSPTNLRKRESRRVRRQSVLPPSNATKVMTKSQLENYRKSIAGGLEGESDDDNVSITVVSPLLWVNSTNYRWPTMMRMKMIQLTVRKRKDVIGYDSELDKMLI